MAANPIVPKLDKSALYKDSSSTPAKQQSLADMLRLEFELVRKIRAKPDNSYINPEYLYIEMNAGPGVNSQGDAGSPIVFLEEAARAGIDYQAHFIEGDETTYQRLTDSLRGYRGNFTTHLMDNACAPSLFSRVESNRFGVVYCDPSNAEIPTNTLKNLRVRFPRVDILINLACASYKRQISLPGYVPLGDRLMDLKQHWVIRKPIDKFQWVMLLGMNNVKANGWPGKEIYSMETDKGREYFEIATETNWQRQERLQARML